MLRKNLSITIIRKRIKNLYLRVRPDGTITVSAPKRCSDKYIRDFIDSKYDWIQEQLEKIEKREKAGEKEVREHSYENGEIHFLWGKPCRLMVEETDGKASVILKEASELEERKTVLENEEPEYEEIGHREKKTEAGSSLDRIVMQVPKNSTEEQWKALLDEFYRACLKTAIPSRMEQYIRIVGKTPTEWRIRKMKTRWGTCNVQDKRIWLSLNLAKKDVRCLEYVIAHELTHLHEPNHSRAFWARMDQYYPEWREIRKLLNEK